MWPWTWITFQFLIIQYETVQLLPLFDASTIPRSQQQDLILTQENCIGSQREAEIRNRVHVDSEQNSISACPPARLRGDNSRSNVTEWSYRGASDWPRVITWPGCWLLIGWSGCHTHTNDRETNVEHQTLSTFAEKLTIFTTIHQIWGDLWKVVDLVHAYSGWMTGTLNY